MMLARTPWRAASGTPRALWALVLATGLVAPLPARAQAPTDGAPSQSFWTRDTLSGDLSGCRALGPVDGANISPTRWAAKRGMIFSSHHDAPVAFPDSMRVLDATVTRRARGSGRIPGPDQRVDVITALKAMTIWPAYHHFEEKTKGSLEPGKLADAHDHAPGEGCPSDAMLRLVDAMAAGPAAR